MVIEKQQRDSSVSWVGLFSSELAFSERDILTKWSPLSKVKLYRFLVYVIKEYNMGPYQL